MDQAGHRGIKEPGSHQSFGNDRQCMHCSRKCTFHQSTDRELHNRHRSMSRSFRNDRRCMQCYRKCSCHQRPDHELHTRYCSSRRRYHTDPHACDRARIGLGTPRLLPRKRKSTRHTAEHPQRSGWRSTHLWAHLQQSCRSRSLGCEQPIRHLRLCMYPRSRTVSVPLLGCRD